MPIHSVNYPVYHSLQDGEYTIRTVNCDGGETFVARGEINTGGGEGLVDISQFARGVLNTDAITIPDFNGRPVAVQETGMMKDFRIGEIVTRKEVITSDTDANLYSVTYGNGIYVAVGYNRDIVTSTDGVNWTVQKVGGSNWFTVRYGGGVFVAGGQLSYIATSTDGLNWSVQETGLTVWETMEYVNGRWIGAGTGGVVGYSEDGYNWTTQTVTYNSWTGCTYGNGIYLICSPGNTIATSRDGRTWTSEFLDGNWEDAIFHDGRFILVGGRNISTSADAVNWETSYVNKGSPSSITYSDYLGLYFIGIGSALGGNAGAYYTSADLKEFTFRDTERVIRDVLAREKEVVMVGPVSYLHRYELIDQRATYTIAYDYNTDWKSNIADVFDLARINNDPIRDEIIKGQYLSASQYNTDVCNCLEDESFRYAGRHFININDERVLDQINSYSGASNLWIDTAKFDIQKGDDLEIEYHACENLWGSISYTIIEDCRVRYVLYYVNKMGGVDHLLMKGKTSESYNGTSVLIDGNYDRSRPSDFQRRKLHTTATRTLLMNTGALTNAQSAKMDNLLLSPKVWVHDLHEGVVYAANITGSSFTVNRMPHSNTNSNNYALSLEIAQDIIRKR